MRRNLNLVALCAASVLALGLAGFQDLKRERGGPKDELKNSIEGKEPPKLVAKEFQNTKPLEWKDLKGKVVVVDFWAYW